MLSHIIAYIIIIAINIVILKLTCKYFKNFFEDIPVVFYILLVVSFLHIVGTFSILIVIGVIYLSEHIHEYDFTSNWLYKLFINDKDEGE